MCTGFGCIVDRGLKIYFCEPDKYGDVSHAKIIYRLNWQDNDNEFLRRFVRVECKDWTPASFKFDEIDTLPGWVEENKNEIKNRVADLLNRIYPAWAECEKVCDLAWAKYVALAGDKVREAWGEYKEIRDPALAEYKKVRNPALARFVSRISSIQGYVPDAASAALDRG